MPPSAPTAASEAGAGAGVQTVAGPREGPEPIDLTLSSSDAEPEDETPASVTNPMPPALRSALHKLTPEQVLALLVQSAEKDGVLMKSLEKQLLVHEKDVVRYHCDVVSEDGEETEESEGESEDAQEEDGGERRKPITVMRNEMTSRHEKCDNCHEQFDVTANKRGDCKWHPGAWEVGYTWTCCEKPQQGDIGCKSTKHKCFANQQTGRKRRASSELKRPVWLRCGVCKERYDENDNEEEVCRFHPGRKAVNYESDFWDDHDENCHGRLEDLIDESEYEEGFMWDCCGEPMDAEGCALALHDL